MKSFEKRFKGVLINRSVISILLVFSVLLTTITSTLILSAESIDIWSGNMEKPVVGAGNQSSPYEISKPEHLAWAIASGTTGNYYKLTCDIYLNDVSRPDWYEQDGLNEWYHDVTFAGHLNGDGHIVYGIWYPESNSYDSVGLVPGFKSGTIEKIGVRKSSITGKRYVGGITGMVYSGIQVIDQCFVDDTVKIHELANDGSYGAGGIVGNIENNRDSATPSKVRLLISNCFSTANVTGGGSKKFRINGIIGQIYQSAVKITDCYSLGVPPYFMGTSSAMTYCFSKATDIQLTDVLTDVYSDCEEHLSGSDIYFGNHTVVPATSMFGDKAKTSMSGLDFENIYETIEDKTPKLRIFSYDEEPETSDDIWDGTTVAPPIEGNGSSTSPFEISKPSQLAWAIQNGNGSAKGKYFKLTADIYLNDVSDKKWYEKENLNVWYGDIEFNGHIDGDGHIVYGIWYPENTSSTRSALVPKMKSGSVKNLGIRHSRIYAQLIAGGIIGEAMSSSGALKEVENCFVDSSVVIKELSPSSVGGVNYSVGGIVSCINNDRASDLSVATLKITNCYSKASILGVGTDVRRKNGILGDNWKSAIMIKNCYSVGISPYYAANPNNQSSISSSVLGNLPIETLANNYTDTANPTAGCPTPDEKYAVIEKVSMIGANARNSMPDLDFDNVYEIVPTGTPKLRVFPMDSEYSDFETPPAEEDNGPVWNGSVAKSFAKGSGKANDPYIITKGSELYLAVTTYDPENKDIYYKLANDIYLNDVEKDKWHKDSDNNKWVPSRLMSADGTSTAVSFGGHIDGDGHIVYGIWYPETNDSEYAGLVPSFAYGTIKNLGVRYAQIYATNYAGGIVGVAAAGNTKAVENCFVDESVTIGYTASENIGAGGIVGHTGDNDYNSEDLDDVRVSIKNCYSKANLAGSNAEYKNGIIGFTQKTALNIENCYSVGYPPYNIRKNGTIPANYWDYSNGPYDASAPALRDISEIFKNVYTDSKFNKTAPALTENYAVLKHSVMVGDNAKTSMSGLDFEHVFETVEGGTPKLKIFTSIDGKDVDVYGEGPFFAGGSGRQGDPYIIKTADQLRYLLESKNTAGRYYELANDIYVNDTTDPNWMENNPKEWYDRGDSVVFSGNFEGNGYSVYGLYVNNTPTEGTTMHTNGAALFPYVNTIAVIRNVHVRYSYISGTGYVGAIVGYVKPFDNNTYASVIGCSADNTVTLKGQTTGGLVGGGNRGLELQYCYFTGTLTSTSADKCNALVGNVWSSFQRVAQCYSIGYQNFRNSSTNIPASVLVLYGTVDQLKTVTVEKEKMYGEAAKSSMPKLNWDIWYTIDGATPHMRVIKDEDIIEFNSEGEKGKVWSGLIATKFAGGTGTENDPYIIETPEQLAYMILQTGNSTGKYYKITADIKLNDTTDPNWTAKANEWVSSSGEWAGKLDGDGHVISGLYFNTSAENAVVGLFQKVVTGAEIRRLGITKSVIISTGNNSYGAAFIGQTIGNRSIEPAEIEDYVKPVISQCFADTSVYIEAYYAGGLVSGNPRALLIENSYFAGELTGERYAATLIGNTWNSYVSTIKNCYSVSLDRDPIMENSGAANAEVIDSYIDGRKGRVKGITSLGIEFMKGNLAKQNMAGFDFENIWMPVEGGTPVLRCFENAEQYSARYGPYLLELSFSSEGGTSCESIFGFAGQPLDRSKLPIPTRRGYVFEGWYTSTYKIIPFSIDYFPDYDMVLYAKWGSNGFDEGFEGSFDPYYDMNSAVEHYKPGLANYNPIYVHGGLKSFHAMGGMSEAPLFLLNYKNALTVGNEYEIYFWICGAEGGSSGSVDLLIATDPHVFSTSEKITSFSYNLKPGEWKELSYKFVARAPYILVKTSSDNDLYYDDFAVAITGRTQTVTPLKPADNKRVVTIISDDEFDEEEIEEGEEETSSPVRKKVVKYVKKKKSSNKSNEGNMTLIITIVAVSAAVLIIAAAVITIIPVRKKRKKADQDQ